MRLRRACVAAVAALPIALAAAALAPAAAAGSPAGATRAGATPVTATPAAGMSRTVAPAVLRAGTAATPTLVAAERQRGTAVAAAAATFRVTYTGFTPAAQASFQRAVDLWAALVSSPVPITVKASFTPLGPGVLGAAGPSFVWRDFAGAPRPSTWYPDATANKRAGRQLHRSPDIVAQFSSSRTDWHYGTAAAPAGKFDFTTVVMHELGHGLGFLGAGRVSGSTGTVRLALDPRLPMAYDRFTENGAGRALLSFPDDSAELANQLRSGRVFFDSAGVRSANGGRPAKLYAPATWQQGSSYSHLDESTYRPGTANSLMTPIVNFGETVRSPGPITRAIFVDVGW
jgi:hypothetical protein